MASASSQALAFLKSSLAGILAAVGMYSIMAAESWAVLSIGWAVLALYLLFAVIAKFRAKQPDGAIRFELGPPIVSFAGGKNRALLPLGIAIVLLGIAGVAIPMRGELSVPNQYGGGLFLIGAGVACLGLYSGNRTVLSAGYALWAIAGAAMTVTAIVYHDELLMTAKLLTLGTLMFFGGAAAAYAFYFGKTRVLEDGIVIGNALCKWERIESWELDEADDAPRLKVSVAGGQWTPDFWVPRDKTDDLRTFLSEQMPGNAH